MTRTTTVQAAIATSLFCASFAILAEQTCTDDEVKAEVTLSSQLRHGDENWNHLRWAFHMAGDDTNNFVRILCDLATEDTNQTEYVILHMRKYKTPASLPFLYSYSTNAEYGAEALKSIFAIEGVTSNSVTATQCYLSITNYLPPKMDLERSELCEGLLRKVFSDSSLSQYRGWCQGMAIDYAHEISTMHISLDAALQEIDSTYHFSKRRLAVMRSAQARCWNDMLYNYVTNAINELVAYPEADLPD